MKAIIVLVTLLLAWGAESQVMAQAKPEAKPAQGQSEAKPKAAAMPAKLQPPKISLERVEIAAYFPYAPPPARVPLAVAFIFNITNPNSVTIAQEDLKFTYSFEAKADEFFELNTATVYETTLVPPKATTQLRVVSLLDSLVAPGNLAVTSGSRVQALGLKPPDVVKEWWEKIGDFPFKIRVTQGVATYSAGKASLLATFEGVFPGQ
ncbi:MAG TPA: hypothetical protein VJO34_13045 [Methylomirabilota bacterium]|nr:hypothetical protein [Methylomirabilota bacterium]